MENVLVCVAELMKKILNDTLHKVLTVRIKCLLEKKKIKELMAGWN